MPIRYHVKMFKRLQIVLECGMQKTNVNHGENILEAEICVAK